MHVEQVFGDVTSIPGLDKSITSALEAKSTEDKETEEVRSE